MHKKFIYIFTFVLFLFSCSESSETELADPSDLSVTITTDEENPMIVDVEAAAENTVEYMLVVDSDEDAGQTNTTGLFQHIFETEGYHDLQIRAYGESGRFIKEDHQIEIDLDTPILPEDGYTTPLTYSGYNLVWQDEFDGTSLNENDWNYEYGTGEWGWGNNELQYYRKQNLSVEDGVLTIEAKNELYDGSNYTSSRITTQSKQYFKYGRIDIKALLPEGQGLWPALWMLGQNLSSVGWPACGEIDIMELVGGSGGDNTTYGTLHWDDGGHNHIGGNYSLSSGVFADNYYVFSIVWDETSIKWYVNDYKFHEMDITSPAMSEFHEPHFFIFNVAVGGNWPGSPDGTTIFPQRMKVDYVRVFQKAK